MERQKTQNSQHNTEGKEQSWRSDTTQLQDSLYSYSDQVSVLLCEVMDTLIMLILVIIAQYICVSNNHMIHFEYIQLYLSIIPQ